MYQLRIYTLRGRSTRGLRVRALAPPHPQPADHRRHHARHLDRPRRPSTPTARPDLLPRKEQTPAAVTTAYMAGPEFTADMEGFDVSNIINVEELLLDPTAASPLS